MPRSQQILQCIMGGIPAPVLARHLNPALTDEKQRWKVAGAIFETVWIDVESAAHSRPRGFSSGRMTSSTNQSAGGRSRYLAAADVFVGGVMCMRLAWVIWIRVIFGSG